MARCYAYKSLFAWIVFCSGLQANDALGSDNLRQKVRLEDIRAHQQSLQIIADTNNGTRAVATEGYAASVTYIESKLKASGYEPKRQDFFFSQTRDNSPPQLQILGDEEAVSFVLNEDFANMSGAGMTTLTGYIEGVDLIIPSPYPNASTSGCQKDDFKDFTRGSIALMQRGSCSFDIKVTNAKDAGAKGVIIFNEGNQDRTEVFSGRVNSKFPDFPIFTASFYTGDMLRRTSKESVSPSLVRLKIDVIEKKVPVQNLIADTTFGDSKRVIVVGAHLDSVTEGPGINDNGSGSSTILTIAEKIASLGLTVKNKVRFAFFGAEELGLLGSKFYVSSLFPADKDNILAMLNFDMLSSSNYVRFVYDGDSYSESSGFIERIFTDYFASAGLVSSPTAFDGRSDYGPFIEAGIPSGGLFSGAEGKKTARLAALYGGIANAPFDPCYHRACDDFAHTGGNAQYELALKSLQELSQAAAHAVHTLAYTDEDLRSQTTETEQPDFIYQGDFLIK